MINRFIHYLIKNKHIVYSLFILITLATLLLTLLPAERLGQNRLFQYDKVGHFMLFFSWTLAYGFLSFFKKGAENTNILAIFVIGSLFGVTIEVMQELLPYGRSANVYDAIADILGSLTASVLLKVIKIQDGNITEP
jgi:VanZ family protein